VTRARAVRVSCVILAVAVALAACTSSVPSRTKSVGSPAPTTSQTFPSKPSPVSMADAKHCPVTSPRKPSPTGGTYGNGKLRVGGLWPQGVLAVGPAYVRHQGIWMKFPWWRMVTGRLRITGRRLDAPAPRLRARVPTGYGPIGFQATGVIFPTEGCWEITGTVGKASLTFVTFVIKRSATGA